MATSKAWLSFNLYLGYVVVQQDGSNDHTFQKCGSGCRGFHCPFREPVDFIVVGSFHTVRRLRPFLLPTTTTAAPGQYAAIFQTVWSIGKQLEVFQHLASPVTELEIQMFLDCTGENRRATHLLEDDSITRQFNLPLMLYFLQRRKRPHFKPDNGIFGKPVFETLVTALLERENYRYIAQGVRQDRTCTFKCKSGGCLKEWVDFLNVKPDYGNESCLSYGMLDENLRGWARKKGSGIYAAKKCRNFKTCQRTCWLGAEIQADKSWR